MATPTSGSSLPGLFTSRRLLATWQKVRWLNTKIEQRDCIDHLEADLDSRRWLAVLRRQVLDGRYRPQQPRRYEAAKSEGFYRVMTIPTTADVVVYRLLADYLWSRARRRGYAGAFFSVQMRPRPSPVGRVVEELTNTEYATFFDIWIRYDEYRRRLLLNGLHRYIVITDVSNFFESVQHQLLLEHIAPYGLPQEAMGILGQLLDTLRPVAGHSPMPPVGLAVEPFDCSRVLGHVFLFSHDRNVLKAVNEGAYVRWMDDQNMGVASAVEARSLLRALSRSLSAQRLVLNSGKTKVLGPADVRRHFWLDENAELQRVEVAIKHQVGTAVERSAAVDALWNIFRFQGRSGNWDRVAARILAAAARVRSDVVTYDDCKAMLVQAPNRAERIFEYLVARSRWADLTNLFDWWLDSGNSLYEDVEMAWFEALLVVTPPRHVRQRIRSIAVEFVRGSRRGTLLPGPRLPAVLSLYWLGDGRQFRVLETLLRSQARIDSESRRALAAVLCAVYPLRAAEWVALAAKEPSSSVSSLVQWVTRAVAGEYFEVPKELVFVRKPWLLQRWVYDARSWLRVELLLLAKEPRTRRAVSRQVLRMRRNPLAVSESVIARRIERRLSP